MPLNHVPISQITLEDLQRLIDDGVIESRQLDYKQTLPGMKDEEKKDFLADVSALANASGGDIVYGIDEKRDDVGQATGVPDKIVGVKVDNFDAWRRQIEQLIADSIEPRIIGVEIEKIEFPSGAPVVLIRIPKSLLSPHMITYQQWSRFYLRGVASNHPMDVSEIREAFLSTASVLERVSEFRLNRVQQVVADACPVDMGNGAKVFLHVIPFGISPFTINFTNRLSAKYPPWPLLLNNSSGLPRLNVDGRLLVDGLNSPTGPRSYLQIFRDGSLEFCDNQLARLLPVNDREVPCIVGRQIETSLISAVRSALRMYETLGITSPLIILVSLIGVRGYRMMYRRDGAPFPWIDASDFPPIDRDRLLLPGQIIERQDADVPELMRPILDTIFNAAGLPQAPGYDNECKWLE